jgi:hypothetical protein
MRITKFDVILNLWVSIVISLILSFVLPMIATGHLTVAEYCSGFAVSLVVSFVLVMFLPVVKLGDMFAAKCGAKPFTLPRQLLTTIVLALIMGTIMSLFMTWWGVRVIPGWQNFFFGAWLKAFPWALLVIYVSANISLWTGIPLTKKILGIPPGPPPGPQLDR